MLQAQLNNGLGDTTNDVKLVTDNAVIQTPIVHVTSNINNILYSNNANHQLIDIISDTQTEHAQQLFYKLQETNKLTEQQTTNCIISHIAQQLINGNDNTTTSIKSPTIVPQRLHGDIIDSDTVSTIHKFYQRKHIHVIDKSTLQHILTQHNKLQHITTIQQHQSINQTDT